MAVLTSQKEILCFPHCEGQRVSPSSLLHQLIHGFCLHSHIFPMPHCTQSLCPLNGVLAPPCTGSLVPGPGSSPVPDPERRASLRPRVPDGNRLRAQRLSRGATWRAPVRPATSDWCPLHVLRVTRRVAMEITVHCVAESTQRPLLHSNATRPA